MAVDWQTSLNWQPGYSLGLPTEFQTARGVIGDAGKGGEFKFAPNDQNAQLLSQLGFGGNPLTTSPAYEGFGGGPAWSDEARQWMQSQGYTVGVGYEPGSSPGGRTEYNGLLDSAGKFVQGQSDPTTTVTDTLMDNIIPFLMMAGPFLSAAGAVGGAGAEAGAVAGAGAGAEVGAGIGTLGAAETGVSALGSAWSPQALGLTGGAAGGVGAAELAALGGALPGAVGGAGALGGAAAAAGGGGAVTSTLPAVSVTGTSAGAGGLSGGQLASLGGTTAAGSFSPSQNYGDGMSGLQTSAYDSTLGVTGSKGAADVVANSQLGSSIWNSPTTKGIADLFSSYGSNSGWMDLIKGGMSLYQSSQMSKAGEPSAAAKTANAQLAALLADPSSMTKLPGYEAGLQAVQRSGAANGYLGSGNMVVGLQKYGGDFYNNTLRQLSSIANEGRGIDQQYNFASTALTGHAINNFGYGLTKLFGD